ncbi:FAD dependent oxidoreductase [Legionella lansingensis]|uniref:Protein CbrA n=1 Tax=Legionella lansingensis TaxID=45067 RepID=A0A0W0VGK8_9GAMM|nr:NAD(P)/FAD-dependent oxidoreductase [Legionella lansingensis]KTD18777.1 FAD dependent oxidoreductase [Legionella lansingensis]SNV58747.1 FAD dependent oxidoreductase [Legionella lansingensis]
MMNCDVDVLIIGGGPAGASTALLLARAGWSVAVVEKKKFPRPKVCGEFISATSAPLMQELGILDFYEKHAGPAVHRVGWLAADKMITAIMPHADNHLSKWGRALARDNLDAILLDAARSAGAQVWQPWTASELIDKQSHFVCKIATKEDCTEVSASLVIIAQGSWEKPLIKGIERGHENSDLLAFKTHFRHCALDQDLMSLISFPGGYGGLVHRDNQSVTLSCCIRRDILQTIRFENPGLQAGDAVLNYMMSTCVGIRSLFSSAQRCDPWLSVGPLRPGIRRCYLNGVFYVGNIAGEAHPIIAEGISMAMQSGWLLANALIKRAPTSCRKELALIGDNYTKRWHKQFANRIRAAACFAQVTTRSWPTNLLLSLVDQFPSLLSFAATLSGKTKVLPFS